MLIKHQYFVTFMRNLSDQYVGQCVFLSFLRSLTPVFNNLPTNQAVLPGNRTVIILLSSEIKFTIYHKTYRMLEHPIVVMSHITPMRYLRVRLAPHFRLIPMQPTEFH